jgi:hypothetical protein
MAGNPAQYGSPGMPPIPASLVPSLNTPPAAPADSKPKPIRPERP